MTGLFWMALFFTGNVVLNVYNKWIFSELGLKLPLFVTMTHMVMCQFGAIVCKFIPTSYVSWTPTQFEDNGVVFKLMVIAVFFSLNTGLNNSSLIYLNLAANQIIRATLPAVTAFVSMFTERKILSGLHYCTIVILVLGVSMSLYKSPEFNGFGTFLCFASTLSGAVHVTVIGNLLGCNLKMQPLDFMYYTSLPILVVLMPAFFMTNEPELIADALDTNGWSQFTILMTIGGCLAFFYNVVHYIFINVTSSVYSTVAGNFKVILVIVVSIVFFKTEVTPVNYGGICLTMLSFGFFSYLSFRDKSKANAAAASEQPDVEATEQTPLKK
jgi:hypothetical protein